MAGPSGPAIVVPGYSAANAKPPTSLRLLAFCLMLGLFALPRPLRLGLSRYAAIIESEGITAEGARRYAEVTQDSGRRATM